MPYIDSSSLNRENLTPSSENDPMTAGELNFCITCMCDQYLAHNLDYQAINDVVGALEGAKLEMYRRIAAPYEDYKKAVNGEVYVTQVPVLGSKQRV